MNTFDKKRLDRLNNKMKCIDPMHHLNYYLNQKNIFKSGSFDCVVYFAFHKLHSQNTIY